MKMKYYYILVILLVVIAGITIYSYYSYTKQIEQPPLKQNTTDTNITTTSTDKDKESCEALGGRWERALSGEEKCYLPTSDAGKECSDYKECEGACIAELSEEDWDKARQGIVYTKGKCAAWKITVGCHAFVKDGKVEGILCLD